jgi:hypothetical protein
MTRAIRTPASLGCLRDICVFSAALSVHDIGTLRGIAYSLEDLPDAFALQRLHRPLQQCSTERWRASPAIGFSRGKPVLCFPWMWREFVAGYRDLWIGPFFGFLRDNGCLVVAPTSNVDVDTICDEVIHIR